MYSDLTYKDPDFKLVQNLKRDCARFAGYKSAWQTALLKSKDIKSAPAIDRLYNTNYMKAEYNHTIRSTRSAQNWQRFVNDSDVYPFLEYMPSVAAEPRDDHRRFYGVIKAVNDYWWNNHYPPIDWGCMCSAKQTRSDKGAVDPPTDVKIPKLFQNNPGKTGKIFTDNHPMIAKINAQNKSLAAQVDKEYERLEKKLSRAETLSFMKEEFKGKKFNIVIDGKKVKTLPLSTKSIKELINQPTANYLTKLELLKQLDTIIKNLGTYTNAKGEAKTKFKEFYYFDILNSDYVLNIGSYGNNYVIYSITDKSKRSK